MPTQFPAIIELSDLNGVNGFRLNGIAAGDDSGISVSAAGDINADGVADLLIGANVADPNGLSSGQSYVVFGGATVGSDGTFELSNLNGSNGFILNGIAAGDGSGVSVSAAGDINADGVDDLIIGAYLAAPNGLQSGQSYLVFGGVSVGASGTLELSNLNGSNGFTLNGIAAQDRSGLSVSAAGDINGDGVADLLIGAQLADPNGSNSGQSYVIFGGASVGSSGTFELSSLNGSNGFTLNGIAAYDFSGYSVSAAGDVNADGVADLLIGATAADPNGSTSGQSYVVFGGASVGSSGTFELSSLNGSNGFTLNGIAANDYSGSSVSAAGDINGNGVADLLIGAYRADPNGPSSGQSYVVFGGASVGSSGTFEFSNLNGTNGFILNGIAANDNSGRSVSTAGDINGNGVVDIIIGAFGADSNGLYSGQSYVVFGGSSVGSGGVIELSSLNGFSGFALNGIAADDRSGTSVSAAGDINADGVDDLIIGAFSANPNGLRSGQSYLVFGAPQPIITTNQLNIGQGSGVVFSQQNLNATFPINLQTNFDINNIVYFPQNVVRGQFELVTNPGIVLSSFTQQQINLGEIIFIHSGANAAPAYDIFAKSYSTSPIVSSLQSATIIYNTIPVLITNNLIIQEGQTLTITSNELSATDPDDNDATLVFTISNIQNSYFDNKNNPGVPITTFTQQQIYNGDIRFTADGSENAPFYRVSVSDGKSATIPTFAQVNFIAVNDAPKLINNKLIVQREGLSIITENELKASDEETPAPNLVFTVLNLSQGQFERFNNPNAPISSFAQRDVESGLIRFNNQNADTLPSYDVQVSDGELTSTAIKAIVSFDTNNSDPAVVNNTEKSNIVRNAVIGATISGFVGLLFLGLKIYIKKKTDKQMQKALAGEGEGVEGQQAVYFRNVISPIANKIFKRIKIRGFTGLSDKKLEAYLDAVARIVAECHEKGVPVDDLAAMNARNQRALIDEIAKHTKQTLVPESGITSSITGFFKAQTNPEAMELAAPMIASLVKASWNATQDRARGYSQAQGIEMTSLGGSSTIDTSRDNPIFERTMSQTSLVGTGAGVGVGAVMTTSTQDVPARQYNVAELLAGFKEEFVGEIESLRTENQALKDRLAEQGERLEQVESKQNLPPPLAIRPKI